MSIEHLDILVVGAGISGISAGYHLQDQCPDKSWAILEARADIGGTWDLFRYPGIRSDSDMYTFGFSFKPWTAAKAISDAETIRTYLHETVREFGIDRHIRFGHRIRRASWSSYDGTWTVDIDREGAEPLQLRCNFLFMCSGYYNYEHGYTPHFPGVEKFKGRVVHPQQWTDDIDWAGKRVVVIGSGATAVTLVPAMAKDAAQVTMLQRSPTYVVSRPAEDALANRLASFLPRKLVHTLVRLKNVAFGAWFYSICRRQPEKAKAGLLSLVRKQLPPDFDVAKHFTPKYNPWEQRLCLVPDGDLFKAIRSGKASVVTDHIDVFNETGILLKSGQQLEADLVVSATGLDLKFIAGLEVIVDDRPVDVTRSLPYKGIMLSNVPNFATVFGYTNASWTLRADLVCEYVCRLINHLDEVKANWVTPRVRDTDITPTPWVDFSSGYFQRGLNKFPHQGSKAPWKTVQNYPREIMTLRFGGMADTNLEFGRAQTSARGSQEALAPVA